MNATTIGLDLAKSAFLVHGDDKQGRVVVAIAAASQPAGRRRI